VSEQCLTFISRLLLLFQVYPGLNSKAQQKKPAQQFKYKTLMSPTKPWNPTLDRSTMLMKSEQSNKAPRFFKMRSNVPRYLGNPASGVKPMYTITPDEASASGKHETKVPPSISYQIF
jgi:hypothetical protein